MLVSSSCLHVTEDLLLSPYDEPIKQRPRISFWLLVHGGAERASHARRFILFSKVLQPNGGKLQNLAQMDP